MHTLVFRLPWLFFGCVITMTYFNIGCQESSIYKTYRRQPCRYQAISLNPRVRVCRALSCLQPPFQMGGTFHLVHIFAVGPNPDKLLIQYAGCYPFLYKDSSNHILWRDEAQNPSLQPPQHQWARSLELIFYNDSANSFYQVFSGADFDFTRSTSGDEWNNKTFFATVHQLAGEEVTASSSDGSMKWRELRCYGQFREHSCLQCSMPVERRTFSHTPMDLPLLIFKEPERMSKNDNKEPGGILVSGGTSQRKRGTNS